MLTTRCHFHPRYRAAVKPKNDCETCRLIYALTHPGNDTLEEALSGMETGKKSNLGVRCRRHRYQATRKPGWKCDACWLLFVLKYQGHKDGERRLGSFNPYSHVIDFVDLRNACANLSVTS